jgi:protocatechuate 3,4-dioxygenase, alpha subunit
LNRDTTPECIGSQTVGPFYAIGLAHLFSEAIAGRSVSGQQLTISGTVFDGSGEPIPDAILELWQATPEGQFPRGECVVAEAASSEFAGFVRLSTHDRGNFRVSTVKPGAIPYLDGKMQAPHIVVLLFMRGLMRHLVTRVYFSDEAGNATDPVLQMVPEDRRTTLIARKVEGAVPAFEWNIHMQGKEETVFFEC